jgi:hypothetical protein
MASPIDTCGHAPDCPLPFEDFAMTERASGTFQVKMVPIAVGNAPNDPAMGLSALAKVWHGDIEGNSQGKMLSAGTAVKDSAAYVAMEKVEGTLKGRSGTFILQHAATMNRGSATMGIAVVPDSGTGELEGLSGTLTINVEGGMHAYELTYALPRK